MSSTVRILEMAHSPFCIPITRALEACGVTPEREEVPNWDRRRAAEVTGGRYYQVPVMIHGERIVHESGPDTQDVARYVDVEFAGGRLFPEEHAGLQAILIHYLENDVEGLTFRLVDPLYMDTLPPVERCLVERHKERKFGPRCVENWRAQHGELLKEAEVHLKRFDQMLQEKPFLLGDAPVYTDFLLYGIIGNMTWKGWNRLPESCQRLQAWNDRMKAYQFSGS